MNDPNLNDPLFLTDAELQARPMYAPWEIDRLAELLRRRNVIRPVRIGDPAPPVFAADDKELVDWDAMVKGVAA